MTVTLKNIAEVAKVSANTVSRALKDKADIGEATKQRIQAIADELGYIPNSTARNLRLKQSNTIGLAVTELDNPVRMALVENIRRNVLGKGLQLLVVELAWDSKSDTSLIEMLVERNIDGLIVGTVSGNLTEHYLWQSFERLYRRQIPVVLFGDVVSERFDCIKEDFIKHGRQMAEHLISLGYKNIVMFDIVTNSPRFMGYKQAMLDAGLTPVVVTNTKASMFGGVEAIQSFVQDNVLPEAIIARNDIQAMGVLSGLRKLGYEVPKDTAVVGFDNITYSSFSNPQLTTIGIDPVEFSNILTNRLLTRIENRKLAVMQDEIDAKMWIRESCGATFTSCGSIGGNKRELMV
jgi:LacI family transcriptional regulator